MKPLCFLKLKAWDCNRKATTVLGPQVESHLEVTFLLNLFEYNTGSAARIIYFRETSNEYSQEYHHAGNKLTMHYAFT